MRSYPQSEAWLERARAVTPHGSQTLSKQACRFPVGAHPLALVSGRGCRVTDVDGHDYIDLICSLGATTLPYHHPVVEGAVLAQILNSGPIFSLPHPLEAEVAGTLCARLGWPQQAKFAKTGSDACSMAVRAARAFTGRDVVLIADNGYHGTHDWYTVTKDQHPGVPSWLHAGVESFAFNHLGHLEALLEEDGVALVMLEPTLYTAPEPGFLAGVVDLAHRHGALVCFDETILGGRMALGGGSEYFGVTPDLAVFGKALGGGYPMAALVGLADVVTCAAGYSGTFFGDAIGLAAMRATLDVYRDEPVIASQWEVGEAIQQTLLDEAIALGLPIIVDGYPFHPRITFRDDADRVLMSTFLQACADRGVLWHSAGVNVPALMPASDVKATLRALRGALVAVAAGEPLRGAVIEASQIRPARAA